MRNFGLSLLRSSPFVAVGAGLALWVLEKQKPYGATDVVLTSRFWVAVVITWLICAAVVDDLTKNEKY